MERGHPEGEASLAAALGRGSVGLALRYAEEDELKELREAVFGAGFAFDGSFEDRYGAAERIFARAEGVGAARERAYLEANDADADGGPNRRSRESAKRLGRAARDGAVAEALELLALLYRDAGVVAAGAPELAVNADRMVEIRARVAERAGRTGPGRPNFRGRRRKAHV
jgi:DNA polymerase-3 subunit delta'